MVRKIYRIARNIIFDLKYGGFLGGIKQTPYKSSGAFDTANSDYGALSLIFTNQTIGAGDVLVDVGCVKGGLLIIGCQ